MPRLGMTATATTPICPGPLAWAGAAAGAAGGVAGFARDGLAVAGSARRLVPPLRQARPAPRSLGGAPRRRGADVSADASRPPPRSDRGAGSEFASTSSASIPEAAGAGAGPRRRARLRPSFSTAVEPASPADDEAPAGTSISASGDVASGDPPEIGGSISSGASAGAEWCASDGGMGITHGRAVHGCG